MRYPFVLLALASLPALAQTPSQALAQKWDTICATAQSGTTLLVRCDETATSSDPNANGTAAVGQHLEEIPGHARIATRDGNTSSDTFKTVVNERFGLLPGGAPATLLNVAASAGLAPDWSLFASLEAGRVERRRGPNEAAFNADTLHASFGVNRQLGARLLAGAVLAHDHEALDYSGTISTADAHFTGLVGFFAYTLGRNWALDAYTGSTHGGYSLLRSVNYVLPKIGGGFYEVDALASAAPDTRRSLRGISLTWNGSHAGWQSELAMGMDESRTEIDGYTESGGGGLALVVPNRVVETRRGRIDARFDRTRSTRWGVWQPSLRIGWRQEFGNERRRVTVHLAEDSLANSVTFDTEDPDRNWGELAFGSVFTFSHGHSAFFEYRQRFAHAFLQERVLAIGWRMEL